MVFEHLVFFFVGLIVVFIPDVPTGVKLQVVFKIRGGYFSNLFQVQREKLLTTEDKFAKELKSFTDTARRVSSIQGGSVSSVFIFVQHRAQLFRDNFQKGEK